LPRRPRGAGGDAVGSSILYRSTGVVLARASTDPGGLDLPTALDFETVEALGAGRVWLAQLWRRAEVRTALRVASPVLSEQVDAIVEGDDADARQLQRLLISTSSYLRRWQRRATPFGLFAGVTAVSVGAPATAQFGDEYQVAVRADARWVGVIIDGLEQRADLLPRLPVVVNNAGFTRGDRFVVPARPDESQSHLGAALDRSVRRTKAVAAALAGAAKPVPVAKLAQRIGERFPDAAPDRIQRLLAGLVASRALLTSLRAPMTTVDPLAHLVTELESVGVEDLPDLVELVNQLAAIREGLSSLNSWALQPDCSLALESAAERMRAIHGIPGRVLAVDVALAGRLAVPEAVLHEAEAAATVLLRLTPFPFGDPAWKDFHTRFLSRYGVGAVVSVRDVVADSGLGYPAGFLGSPRPRAAHVVTERDVTLLALIEQATAEGRTEITLTEQIIADLRVGDHAKMVAPARVELAFQLHAASPEALERGQFRLWITGVPMHATSMAGRFAHLLPEEDQQRLAATYTPASEHTITAQLSFPPRREHNENITRTPRLLPHVIALAEHRGDDQTVIRLDDLAVTADTSQMSLVRISTGQRVQPHIPHALETTMQTPPLARFLAEVASARCGAFGPFGFGVAHDLPFHPRIRYGRLVLSPARWLLQVTDLPWARSGIAPWDHALSAWRDRWRVPSTVVLCEGELRLPLDLDDRCDRTLLRSRLGRNRTGKVELRESGAHDGCAWAGRACELVVALGAVPSPDTPPRSQAAPLHTVTRSGALLPGELTCVACSPPRSPAALRRHPRQPAATRYRYRHSCAPVVVLAPSRSCPPRQRPAPGGVPTTSRSAGLRDRRRPDRGLGAPSAHVGPARGPQPRRLPATARRVWPRYGDAGRRRGGVGDGFGSGHYPALVGNPHRDAQSGNRRGVHGGPGRLAGRDTGSGTTPPARSPPTRTRKTGP
jgi:hypothetical protein